MRCAGKRPLHQTRITSAGSGGMRPSVLFRWLLLMCAVSPVFPANDRVVPPYTMEEVYERAGALIHLAKRVNLPKDNGALTEFEIKAAEFRGYVAGILDGMEFDADLQRCSKNNQLTTIALETAIVLSSLPIRRDREPKVAVSMSLQYGCDELLKKAK
jgi:hypothetical protein